MALSQERCDCMGAGALAAGVFGGAVFLLIVDNVSRNVTSAGIPIGILTAFVGAPFFLWLITGRRHEE